MTTTSVAATQTAAIRWASFYGDRDEALRFPAAWDVTVHEHAGGDDIGEAGIAAAFDNPIGSAPIRELAAGKGSAVVVVDDLTRPTPAARLLPRILRELHAAGLTPADILILAGVANHRVLTRDDFIKKVGEEVVNTYRTRSHFSWANCDPVGTTSRGTPVSLNSEFLAAECRILVGSIMPHNKTGFSGGSKLVLPGVAHIDTAHAWHGPDGPRTGLIETASESRLDSEEVARLAGVDCIVNVIPNAWRGIAGLVVGDLVEAHRAGVAIARRVYATLVPSGVDVCVLASYPKDAEYQQTGRGFHPLLTAPEPIVRPGGTIVLAGSTVEGPGFHSLYGPGMPMYGAGAGRAMPGAPDMVYFMPGMAKLGLPPGPRERVALMTDWADVQRWLSDKHGDRASVAVFPCATLQIAAGAGG
ncbi:MAG: lactate racemase domain-containing protein [Chloroflexi bacterium]|nr:lactate racemase domain-containing protein [Chloroflexota bacterium]